MSAWGFVISAVERLKQLRLKVSSLHTFVLIVSICAGGPPLLAVRGIDASYSSVFLDRIGTVNPTLIKQIVVMLFRQITGFSVVG